MRRSTFMKLEIIYICLGAALATDCPDTWIPFQGSCYHFETSMALKFSEAEAYRCCAAGVRKNCHWKKCHWKNSTGEDKSEISEISVDLTHYCQTRDARLVHVDNSDENTFIRSYLIANKHGDSWIGLTDIDTEGLWQWYDTNTKPNYTDWAPGMPDGHSDANCVQYYHALGYKWDDVGCNDANQPICEIRKDGSVDIIG